MSVTKSGSVGPDGVTTYYDTLEIDQTLLTDSDIDSHYIIMRVYQDPSDGDITDEITYSFTVTAE